MENLINKYPNIISDFSQLMKFSFNKIFKHFNKKISNFKTEYYFLINVNKSLFLKKEINNDSNFIDVIINVMDKIKKGHKSAKIKIFTYKKYVKEIIKIRKDDENIDKKKIIDLLMKEMDNSPQSDIILSLSDLYMKIEQNLMRGNNEKNKLMKIIIINNENEKYNKYNEKDFDIKDLENVLNIFINEKSSYFGVEFIYSNNKKFQNEEKISMGDAIYKSDELWKKGENLNDELYEKWKDIYSNEDINEGIKKLDELLKFFKNVLNSIFFIKNKIKNIKDEKAKEKYIQKIEDNITSSNINNTKDGIISSDVNESYMEEINSYKKTINEIIMNNFIDEEIQNKKEINSICVNNISKYLLKQKENIFQFLGILEKSASFVGLIEKEIFEQTKDVMGINNNNINTISNISEKAEEEENEDEEIK